MYDDRRLLKLIESFIFTPILTYTVISIYKKVDAKISNQLRMQSNFNELKEK